MRPTRKLLAGLVFALGATAVSMPARGSAPDTIYRDWSMRTREKVTVARVGSDHHRGTTRLTIASDGTWSVVGGATGTWDFANAAETKVAVTLGPGSAATVESMLEDWAASDGIPMSVTLDSSRIVAKFSRAYTKLRVNGVYRFTATAFGKTRHGVYVTVDKSQ